MNWHEEAAGGRVSVFLNQLAGGGAERNLLELCRWLIESGNAVDLVLAERRGPLLAEVPDGLRIVEIGTRSRLGTVPMLLRLPRASRLGALRMLWRRPLVGSLGPFVDYLRHEPWDFVPVPDASNQYMRNHLDLNDVERSRRA